MPLVVKDCSADIPGMRTRTVFASAAALLVLASCTSCGGGGGGGSNGSAGSSGAPASTADVSITWRGTDPNVAGYVVHWGTESHVYAHDVDVSKPMADAQGAATVVIAVPTEDSASTYYFAISSYDGAGGTSAYSNELSIDVAVLD
jgi:hypothetical protein